MGLFAKSIAGVMILMALASFAHAAERHLVLDDCVVVGCANQLCVEASAPPSPAASLCEHGAPYSCYATLGECKRQPDGACGWTQTDGLKVCLAHPPAEPGSKAPKVAASPQKSKN